MYSNLIINFDNSTRESKIYYLDNQNHLNGLSENEATKLSHKQFIFISFFRYGDNYGITKDYELYKWNINQQLEHVGKLPSLSIIKFIAFPNNLFIITRDGELYRFENNILHQIKLGIKNTLHIKDIIYMPERLSTKFFVLTVDGEIWSWDGIHNENLAHLTQFSDCTSIAINCFYLLALNKMGQVLQINPLDPPEDFPYNTYQTTSAELWNIKPTTILTDIKSMTSQGLVLKMDGKVLFRPQSVSPQYIVIEQFNNIVYVDNCNCEFSIAAAIDQTGDIFLVGDFSECNLRSLSKKDTRRELYYYQLADSRITAALNNARNLNFQSEMRFFKTLDRICKNSKLCDVAIDTIVSAPQT